MEKHRPSRKKGVFRWTLLALAAAILLGLGLRFFGSPGVNAALGGYMLTPLKTMFLNALKLVVGPVVFFMIASSVAGISDLKVYGRIGAKVLGLYLLTSVAAICVGVGVSAVLDPAPERCWRQGPPTRQSPRRYPWWIPWWGSCPATCFHPF